MSVFKPQWGKSFAIDGPALATVANNYNQLVRLKLGSTQDITLYMEGQSWAGGGFYARYLLSHGAGGISLQQRKDVIVPAVGRVMHIASDAVEVSVRYEFDGTFSVPAGSPVRIAACAAFGRPELRVESSSEVVWYNAGNWPITPTGPLVQKAVIGQGWQSVSNAQSVVFRIPAYAERVRFVQSGFGTPADFTVLELRGNNVISPSSNLRTLDKYADWQPFNNDTMFLWVETSLATTGKIMASFEVRG